MYVQPVFLKQKMYVLPVFPKQKPFATFLDVGYPMNIKKVCNLIFDLEENLKSYIFLKSNDKLL